MKKMHYVLATMVIIMAIGQVKLNAAPVDTSAVRMEVTNNLAKLHNAMKNMDKSAVSSLLAKDVLFLGTDPGEIMDKSGALGMMDNGTVTYSDSDKSDKMDYSVNTRKVMVSEDGKSAITVEQFMVPQFSKEMPVRLITHMIQTPEGWKFDFVSWNFIPPNGDLKTIDEALED